MLALDTQFGEQTVESFVAERDAEFEAELDLGGDIFTVGEAGVLFSAGDGECGPPFFVVLAGDQAGKGPLGIVGAPAEDGALVGDERVTTVDDREFLFTGDALALDTAGVEPDPGEQGERDAAVAALIGGRATDGFEQGAVLHVADGELVAFQDEAAVVADEEARGVTRDATFDGVDVDVETVGLDLPRGQFAFVDGALFRRCFFGTTPLESVEETHDRIVRQGCRKVAAFGSFAVIVSSSFPRRSVIVALLVGLGACSSSSPVAAPTTSSSTTVPSTVPPTTTTSTTTTTTTTTTTLVPPDGKTADQRTLRLVDTIASADLQPKSVVHSGNGLFFAQNMMYRHNVSVFDRAGELVATIPDSVDLADFGAAVEGRGTVVKGSPVEVAFTSDGAHAYVSNYKMYGDGWNPVADDLCQGRNWDPSFVYRIDVATFTIDRVIPVGAVPKYLAVSPDDRVLVVANWCSLDVSLVELATGKELARVDVGLHPRGIAITKDSRTAYVAVMGAGKIVAVDLGDYTTRNLVSIGGTPRHLVLSPDDSVLYATTNRSGTVRAIDPATDTVIGTARTGEQTRSMDISDDGTALYVVNYASNTLSKVRTSDMTVVGSEPTGTRPVGVTYDRDARRVWVANYTGSLSIYADE